MKALNKFFVSAVAAVSAAGMCGCTDLNENLYDTIAAENHEFTDTEVQSMFAPVYSTLRTVMWGWFGYSDIMEMASDAWCVPYRVGIGWGDLYIPLHKHQFNPEMSFFFDAWNRNYSGINACNKLLANEKVQESEESMSQLRAYRALYYYILFDLFRNIPLDTQFDHEAGWQPSQEDPHVVYDFIVSELEDIKESCGNKVVMGKINNYAVHMLLAKMYINRNAWFPNEPEDMVWYQKAIDELNAVMAGPFSLSPNYLDNFREDISGSPEIIFGIPFQEKYAGGNYSANLWMHNAGRATWGFNGWATGGGAVYPQFLDTYDKDDSRYRDCWISGPQFDKNGNPIFVDTEQLNYTRELHSIEKPGCYPMESERLVKYEIIGGDFGSSYDDVPFFRLADAMLMKAECLLRLGGYAGETEQTAADLVTQVRARNFKSNPAKAIRTVAELKGASCYKYGHRENQGELGGPDKWIITEEGGADIIMGGLLDEYGWEFVAEGQRRQVLIRFNMTNGCNVWNGKSWFCKDGLTNPADRHYDIYPIHRDVLGGNPKLVQNPGYSSSAE